MVYLNLSILFLVAPLSLLGAGQNNTIRVLFIGNSYTSVNNLPKTFAKLAHSGGHEVEVDVSVSGGWTLSDHAKSTKTLNKIRQEKWDFVILQEQSVLPSIAGARNTHMYPAARVLDAEIKEANAGTIFFMTWGRRNGLSKVNFGGFDDMQAELYSGYMGIADELDAMVAPVGIAWQNAVTKNPQLDFWQNDGSHPNKKGTYLSACILYSVIYRENPEGLTYTANLPEKTGLFLQAIAAETVLDGLERWNIPENNESIKDKGNKTEHEQSLSSKGESLSDSHKQADFSKRKSGSDIFSLINKLKVIRYINIKYQNLKQHLFP